MNKSVTFKSLIIATVIVVLAVGCFFVHALAGLNSHPVMFAEPPEFVARYAAKMQHSDSLITPKEAETNNENIGESKINESKIDKEEIDKAKMAKWMENFSDEEELAFKAVMTGETLDEFYRLISHPEKAQRVKIAAAYAAIHVRYSHHEESGFGEKRNQFNANLNEHLADFRNALSEALIASAREGTVTRIPYTLAWLPGQGRETIELFEWSAKHHPQARVRRASIYFVAKLAKDEKLVDSLLRSKSHDPDYRVRKLALDLRYRKFTGDL